MNTQFEIMKNIQELVKSHPNDIDLGRAVRKFLLDYKEEKSDTSSETLLNNLVDLKDGCKVGKYRMVLAGAIVWSIALQEHVIFQNDILVKITNTIHGDKDYVFGTLQLLIFENIIPTAMDKVNGDIGFLLKDSIEWEVPTAKF